MIYAAAVLVACWALALYGAANHIATQLRMIRGRTVFPVPGVRVASTRVLARLAALPGESGVYRGMIWARTPTGLACRASSPWFSTVADCRQDDDHVVVDAVLPSGVRLFFLGFVGFGSVVLTTGLALGAPHAGWMVVPIGLMLVGIAQYVFYVRRVRAAGVALARFVEAACAGR